MLPRTKVLSLANGSLDSSVVFIAEAPGRLGADKYGIPLHGDQTGRNFEELLCRAGINRESVFITNAILCNPRNTKGNNDRPTKNELRNCSHLLEATLDIIKPQYVVPLGAAALAALNLIHNHELILNESVAQLFPWNDYMIYPLYHPSPRGRIKRDKKKQIEDFQILTKIIVDSTYSFND